MTEPLADRMLPSAPMLLLRFLREEQSRLTGLGRWRLPDMLARQDIVELRRLIGAREIDVEEAA